MKAILFGGRGRFPIIGFAENTDVHLGGVILSKETKERAGISEQASVSSMKLTTLRNEVEILKKVGK